MAALVCVWGGLSGTGEGSTDSGMNSGFLSAKEELFLTVS